MPSSTQNMTGDSHPAGAEQASTRRDLTSWWKQFKKTTRKEEAKGPKTTSAPGIFGVPLQTSIKYANVAISLIDENGQPFTYGYVPIVVAKCGVFLKEQATDVEGIFRLAGAERRIKELQALFNSPEKYGKGLDWTGYTVHDAANILRRYFNQLPEPIIPLSFYERFRNPIRHHQSQAVGEQDHQEPAVGEFDQHQVIRVYQALITELPPLNRQLLLYILDLLAVFASKSETNRMTAPNLAAIFQPGILSHPDHDMAPKEYRLSQDVLIFLILNQDNFIVGMEGTAADEQTIQEVQSGGAAATAAAASSSPQNRAAQNLINRSASTASAGADSIRKFGGIRRNVSVSSKRSKQSAGNSTSPQTPPPDSPFSAGGKSGGLARSNTVPSKRSDSSVSGTGPSRFSKDKSPEIQTATYVTRGPNSPSPLAGGAINTTPDGKFGKSTAQSRNVSGGSAAPTSERIPSGRMSPHLRPVAAARNRSQEGRKPNKLQKKRPEAGIPISSQSSTASLIGASHPSSPGNAVWASTQQPQQSDSERLQRLEELGSSRAAVEHQDGAPDTAHAPQPNAARPVTPPDASRPRATTPQRTSRLQHEDREMSRDSVQTVRPSRSPAGSIGSKSDGHDNNSLHEHLDEHDSGERKERRHNRWKFSMSRKGQERDKEQQQQQQQQQQRGMSNPNRTTSTLGSSQGAKESSSSVGSTGKPRRSFTDDSGGPFAGHGGPEVMASGASASSGDNKKSPLGWFKDKLQEIKEKDDQFFEKRAKSPPPTTNRGDALEPTTNLDAAAAASSEAEAGHRAVQGERGEETRPAASAGLASQAETAPGESLNRA